MCNQGYNKQIYFYNWSKECILTIHIHISYSIENKIKNLLLFLKDCQNVLKIRLSSEVFSQMDKISCFIPYSKNIAM